MLLPKDLQDRRPSARILGAEMAANFARYAGAVELPIIGVSLRWLLEHEKVSPHDLYVHLFASDQPAPPITAPDEWHKDSLPFAQVIRRALLDGVLRWTDKVEKDEKQQTESKPLQLPGRQVHIHTIPGNPADYNNMLDYFSQQLPSLADQSEGPIYLEVTGGTPAMTSMLIVAGVEIFGRRAQTLYVERGADRPYRVGIGRRLFSRRARLALRSQLELHAYAVAGSALAAEKSLIAPDTERYELLAALLAYADRRLAFDFERARDALHRAGQYATGVAQSQVQYWQRELKRDDSAALLAELVHSTRVKYALGDYADFVNRLFRFQEAAFRHLGEQMGLRYKSPKDDRFVSPAWVASVAGLGDFLDDYPLEDGKRGIKLDIPLNRVSLGAIVDFYTQRDPTWAHRRDVAEKIHHLSKLSRLRNKGIAGHGFEGIGQTDLSQAFGDAVEKIVPFLKEIYAAIFGQPIGSDPYSAANDLILKLLTD
jgi:hypothetical protein